MDAGGSATQGAVAEGQGEGNKSNVLLPPLTNLSYTWVGRNQLIVASSNPVTSASDLAAPVILPV